MNKTKSITAVSLLSAIVVIVSFFPLKTLGLEISFSMVPVCIGAVCFGPSVGTILGGVFGTVSFLQCFGFSPFGALLLTENPISTAIMCIPTRIAAGYLTGLVFKLLKSKSKNVALILSSLLSPFLNTVFFMSALVLCFYNTDTVQFYVKTLSAANPFIFVILFVGINGIAEIIAGCIVAYPVSRGLLKYLKK